MGGVLALVVLGSLLAAAPPAGRVPTIGYVGIPNEPTESRFQDGFVRGLSELGYVPGRTVVIEARSYVTSEQLHKILNEFVVRKVDVIFVGQPFAAMAAKHTTRDIPIVCGSCGDPTENGLAVSLARPGGNVTGLASLSAELIAKRVELVKELLPGASRLAVFVFPANPGTPATVRALDAAGPRLGLELQRFDLRSPEDFEGAFRSAATSRAHAVLLQDDPLLRTTGSRVAELALKHRLPVSTGVSEVADAGALMAYGPDRVELYRRAAGFVHKILKGAKPGDLPFEQAARFALVLNLRTARALGVSIPQAFLLRADRVID